MKSTYYLIGTPWDGKPVSGRAPVIAPFDPTITETGGDDNLFDLKERRRILRVSDLLSCNDDQQVEHLIDSVADCRTIYIAIDWHPRTTNPTIISFFQLRVRQVLCTISNYLLSATVKLMDVDEAAWRLPTRRLTLPWLIDIATSLESYAVNRHVKFDQKGFPLIPASSYATSAPIDMLPYDRRNSRLCKDPKSTAICFFTDDRKIYPRFEHLMEEIDLYRQYAAVVVPDLTVTEDMDEPWQAFIMLLNQLFGAILAVNGIKIIANTRCGTVHSQRYLQAVPQRVACASGSLGCTPVKSPEDYSFTTKILARQPAVLLIYGKRDRIAENQLAALGVNVKRYPDAHTRSSRLSRKARERLLCSRQPSIREQRGAPSS